MCFVKSNLAREAGRIVDWKEKYWGRRYRAIEISDEEAAWVERLRYMLSQVYASYCTSFVTSWIVLVKATCFASSGKSSSASGGVSNS